MAFCVAVQAVRIITGKKIMKGLTTKYGLKQLLCKYSNLQIW